MLISLSTAGDWGLSRRAYGKSAGQLLALKRKTHMPGDIDIVAVKPPRRARVDAIAENWPANAVSTRGVQSVPVLSELRTSSTPEALSNVIRA